MATDREKLEKEINKNFREYLKYPRDRTEKGQLIDPVAQLFEQRMNTGLETLSNMLGETALVELDFEVDVPEAEAA